MLLEKILQGLRAFCALAQLGLQALLQLLQRLLEWAKPKLKTLCEQLKLLLQEWYWAVKGLFHRLWMSVHGWNEEETPIRRRKHRRRTYFHFGTHESSQKLQMLRMLCSICLIVVLVISVVNLVSYGLDYMESKNNTATLRELYYQDDGQEQEVQQVAAPAPTAEPTAIPTAEPTAAPDNMALLAMEEPFATPEAAPTPRIMLEAVNYPGNPHKLISSDFERLRRQNRDIVGWLKIENLIDEVVVQRDNSYYLRRDYRGYHNVNGAIFMDVNCKLDTRPYTYALYGHNMKSGLMFGNLRNYENLTFYKKNPFVTFDTIYESGRYVIFAAGTISTDPSHWQYLNLSWLFSSSIEYRTKGISQLKRFSVFTTGIDVRPEDQLLLLITCVGDEEDRRVVAARRIRDNESEQSLMQLVRVAQVY